MIFLIVRINVISVLSDGFGLILLMLIIATANYFTAFEIYGVIRGQLASLVFCRFVSVIQIFRLEN